MYKMDLIKEIEREAKIYFVNARPTHDWSHIERVRGLSERIGVKEDADMFIVRLAVLLHDSGRGLEDKSNGKFCHAEESEKIAREILTKYDLEKNIIDDVCYAISVHRFRKSNSTPKTIESKVLYDSDKLDSIGAIGVVRAYSFSGENGFRLYSDFEEPIEKKGIGTGYEKDHTVVREFLGKLMKVKDKMLTAEGKRIAESRHSFIVGFFDRLKKEVYGQL